MKKLAFMFVAFAAISFASCGGQTTENTEGQDSDTVAVAVDSAADSAKVDSAAAPAAPAEEKPAN